MADRQEEPATEAVILIDPETGQEVRAYYAGDVEAEREARVPAPLDVERLTDLLRRAKPHLYAVDRKGWCWCDITVPGTPHDPDCKWMADAERVGALRSEIEDLLSNQPSTEPTPRDAAYPTIDYGRLTEIIEEIEAAAIEASKKVGGRDEVDYYRGQRDAEEWVVSLLQPSTEPAHLGFCVKVKARDMSVECNCGVAGFPSTEPAQGGTE